MTDKQEKPTSVRLLCMTSADHGLPQYATVELSAGTIRWLLTKMLMAKVLKASDDLFFSLTYFRRDADYYYSAFRCADLQSGDFIPLTTEHGFVGLAETAAETVQITDNTVCWQASLKHTGSEFETATMTEEQLKDYLRELDGA